MWSNCIAFCMRFMLLCTVSYIMKWLYLWLWIFVSSRSACFGAKNQGLEHREPFCLKTITRNDHDASLAKVRRLIVWQLLSPLLLPGWMHYLPFSKDVPKVLSVTSPLNKNSLLKKKGLLHHNCTWFRAHVEVHKRTAHRHIFLHVPK